MASLAEIIGALANRFLGDRTPGPSADELRAAEIEDTLIKQRAVEERLIQRITNENDRIAVAIALSDLNSQIGCQRLSEIEALLHGRKRHTQWIPGIFQRHEIPEELVADLVETHLVTPALLEHERNDNQGITDFDAKHPIAQGWIDRHNASPNRWQQ